MRVSRFGAAAAATVSVAAVGLGANALSASATTEALSGGWPVRSASAAEAITTGRTIELVGHEDRSAVINVGPAREGPGDYFVFEETLRDRASGRVVGRTAVQCTLNFTAGMFNGTFILAGKGSVQIAGSFTRANSLLAVTGGTGQFQNARGQLHVGGTTGEGDTNLTLHLLP